MDNCVPQYDIDQLVRVVHVHVMARFRTLVPIAIFFSMHSLVLDHAFLCGIFVDLNSPIGVAVNEGQRYREGR